MKKPKQQVKPVLKLMGALRDSPFEGVAQAILFVVLVAEACSSVAASLVAAVGSFSGKGMMALYRGVSIMIDDVWKLIWSGPERDIDRIRALTTWGKAKSWFLVGTASIMSVALSLNYVLVQSCALCHFTTISMDVFAEAMASSALSFLCARKYFLYVKADWPIA